MKTGGKGKRGRPRKNKAEQDKDSVVQDPAAISEAKSRKPRGKQPADGESARAKAKAKAKAQATVSDKPPKGGHRNGTGAA